MEKFIHMIKNNIYMLKLAYKMCPVRVVSEFVIGFIDNSFNVFYVAFFSRTLINYVQSGYKYEYILSFLILSSVMFLLNVVLRNLFNGKIRAVYDQVIISKFNLMLFDKIKKLDIMNYDEKEYYEKYKLASEECDKRVFAIMSHLSGCINSLYGCICLAIILYNIDVLFLLITIIPVFSKTFFGKKVQKDVYSLKKENSELQREKAYIKSIICSKDYVNELRIYNIFNLLKNNYVDASKNIMKNVKKRSRKLILFTFLTDVLNTSVTFLFALLYAAYKIIVKKNMLIGELAIVSVTIINLSSKIVTVFEAYLGLMSDAMFVDNFKAFLYHKTSNIEKKDGVTPCTEKGKIEFSNVSFKYKEREEFVLKKINLSINVGEKVAIVGRNGAGKSTLIKLILRLYDANEGCIRYDGMDIKSFNTLEYRKLFGVIFQDFKLFSLSIYDNVVLGNEEVIEEEVLEALKYVGLLEKVQQYKNGIETTLYKEFDEEGVILSGGEMQKLVIARLFLSKCKMFLLDEPTSALDPKSEREVLKNIFDFCHNKTIIYISHNIFSAKMADKIFVVSHGEIVEEGNHKDLLDKKGYYYNMYKEQEKRYKGIDDD